LYGRKLVLTRANDPFNSAQTTDRHYGHDFLASTVVFLVALPLCLGIAIASGVPPALGLVSGIIGGLVVGAFSGAPLQVSGPAAGLVSIVWEVVQTHGIGALGLVVALAGIFQLMVGYFNLASWFRAVSPAVVQGMLAGIGVLIFSSQFHVMVDDKPSSNGLENILGIPQAIYKGLLPVDGTSHHIAAAIGLLTISIIVLWSLFPKRIRLIPAALIAVGTSVWVANTWHLPINYVSIPDAFLEALHLPRIDHLELLGNGAIWLSALTVAFVATAETMISTTAMDQLHTGPRAKYDKEIMAQGIGNTLAGLLGSLPVTGVIVRSTANIDAGAQSRLSTVLHGLWIGLLVWFLPHILEMIPIASLAAILVYTGYKLIRPGVVKELWQVGKSEVAIYAITLMGVVCTNLLEGVLMGFALASLRLLYVLSKLHIDRHTPDNSQAVHLTLSGCATFISLPILSTELEGLPAGQEVHIHLAQLHYVDHACLELLTNWEKQYQANGGTPQINWQYLPKSLRFAFGLQRSRSQP